MADFVRYLVERGMTIDFRRCRLEQVAFVFRIRCKDGYGRDDPERYAFATPRIDIAAGLQRHLCIVGVDRTAVAMRQSRARADENFPERRRFLGDFRVTHFSARWLRIAFNTFLVSPELAANVA